MFPEVNPSLLVMVVGGGYGIIGVALAEIANAERVPLAYYFATFTGLALVVAVVKFWAWIEDRQKKELTAVEARLTAKLEDQFEAHNRLDDERHRRIEEMIRSAIPGHGG